ncbi:DegV family protein [Natranaerofaba carboxydovora]|uniref:DegV family protein n=1 Tax=Natranaerofaba carboxydovora TaxID=2742683 RepID=UPI001F12A1E8|nr:DegV family protein [Natranaerofaba carboxydovora]UMZ73570.1 DegV domain-containing protein [Natranaerofaba carboxydovora]
MVSIVTDSSCDLPDEILEKYGIHVVPLKITIDGDNYIEKQDITAEEFIKKMIASDNLPKTAQPSPGEFSEIYNKLTTGENGGNEVICITISSGLSGTFQSAYMGKDLAEAGDKVTVFDSLAASLGHGLYVLKAAQLAQEGYNRDKIIEELTSYREQMEIFILLDTLENIVKGGRLSKFKGSMAGMLNIKVLLEGIDGKVHELEKVRGKKKFLKRFLDIVGERRQDFSDTVFGITHVNNSKDAEFIKEEVIKRYNPKDVIINNMGATIGTYAGDGGMVICF